tara:strand:- start:3381 stop:4670 length:1290 start_codon:yes stop_codon:yes gene_type:complete
MKELSENTIALYSKNVSRVEDVVGDILDVKSVIKFIETGVSARGGKPFSVSTKRNLYTALIYQLTLDIEDKLDEEVPEYKEKAKTIDWVKKQDLNENIITAYIKYNIEQDKLNEILFNKYNKEGTINPEKSKAKQEGFTKKDYENLLSSLTAKHSILEETDFHLIYGEIDGDVIADDVVAPYFVDDTPSILIDAYKLQKTPDSVLNIYILLQLFYIHSFRNEIGNLRIIAKNFFDKYYGFEIEIMKKKHNWIVVDELEFEIVRAQYKTDKTYGVIRTPIENRDLKVALATKVYNFKLETFRTIRPVPKEYKWSAKSLKEIKKLYAGDIKDPEIRIKTKDTFKYKIPQINNHILVKTLKKGFLFDNELSSDKIQSMIRPMAKVINKNIELSPTMIVKLGIGGITPAIKELQKKAKSRGHSTSTQLKTYLK